MFQALSQSPYIELWRLVIPVIQGNVENEFSFDENIIIINEFYSEPFEDQERITCLLSLRDTRILLITFDYYENDNSLVIIECYVKNSYFTPVQQERIRELEKMFPQGNRIA